MPYLPKSRRDFLNNEILAISEKIETAADLNYVVFMLMLSLAKFLGFNYAAQNSVMGAIDCSAKEYYRTVVGPYEDEKRTLNGPIN